MKINKSKLKNMVEKGAPVAPVSIKRKRVDEGQSSQESAHEPGTSFHPTTAPSRSDPRQGDCCRPSYRRWSDHLPESQSGDKES
jgi:hypothetical protein